MTGETNGSGGLWERCRSHHSPALETWKHVFASRMLLGGLRLLVGVLVDDVCLARHRTFKLVCCPQSRLEHN